ncbi:MAG: hypothetical protein JWL84_1838 [Rhodospirillales bacterium]|nr:hypothetical protein [Rhodospirillales bacterium]
MAKARAQPVLDLAALADQPNAELRLAWRRLHRCDAPVRLSRDLLLRAVAYRLQEDAIGGLSAAVKRRLRALAQSIDQDGAADGGAALESGARLVRGWRGRTHVVTVIDDGFDYEGERYASLSEIARQITGARWSGPRFFGLTKRPDARAAS